MIASRALCKVSASSTSPFTYKARPFPFFGKFSITFLAACSLRPRIATFALHPMSAAAISRPNTPAPPVTRTVRPVRSYSEWSSSRSMGVLEQAQMFLEVYPKSLMIGIHVFMQSCFHFHAETYESRAKGHMQDFTRMKIIQQCRQVSIIGQTLQLGRHMIA